MKHGINQRRHTIAGVLVVVAIFGHACEGMSDVRTPAVTSGKDVIAASLETGADSLDAALVKLDSIVAVQAAQGARDSASLQRIQNAFRESRKYYKRIEASTEFYAPALAAALNSRRQEVDDDDAPPPASLSPGGFPALETIVFPASASNGSMTPTRAQIAQLDTIVRGMRHVVSKIRDVSSQLVITDAQLVEIARLELTRLSTLSIAGFDTPVTLAATTESAEALNGLRDLFEVAGLSRWPKLVQSRAKFDARLKAGAEYFASHPDFESFDRLTYLASFAAPMSQSLDALRKLTVKTPVGMKRGWRSDVASVYDSAAFNPFAYAADDAVVPSAELVALGRKLFFEPALSGNGARSCSSCHMPSHAFTDGLTRAARIDRVGLVARHTPTLLNAALAPAQFADERAITLEEQVMRVVENPAEMGGSLEVTAAKLSTRSDYVTAFNEAFASTPTMSARDGRAIDATRIRIAVAAYVRSLSTMNSRFDRAARGDTALITARERHGFNVFMGKAGCGTCHFAPLFNGNTPPLYLNADVEVIGTPRSPNSPAIPDADSGRAAIDGLPRHHRAFKTPTVRNATLTAPYMHNGAFRSLDEVIRFYDHGGGLGSGAKIANQTLGPAHLNLTADDRAAIIAFLGTLEDVGATMHAEIRTR